MEKRSRLEHFMNHPEAVFVTVLAWPKAWAREQIAGALVEALGVGIGDAQLIAPLATPCVVAHLDPDRAKVAVRALRERKVAAVGIAAARVAALLPPILAKRLVRADGAPEPLYMVEAWRGEGRGLRMRDVVLLVRGRIPHFTKTTSVEVEVNRLGSAATGIPIPTSHSITEMRGGYSDALDLYTEEGPAVRISGRFDFAGLLGKGKGLTDGENMDRTALKLGEEANGALIDLGFREFKPPRGVSLKTSTVSNQGTVKRDDTPAFDFYSAWISLVQGTIREWQRKRAE